METRTSYMDLTRPVESEVGFHRRMEHFAYNQMTKFDGIKTSEQLYVVTKSVLEGLGIYLESDRVFIYNRIGEEHVPHVKYGWRAWNKTNSNLHEAAFAKRILEVYHSELLRNEPVVIEDPELISEADPTLYNMMLGAGVRSWVSVAMIVQGRLEGILSVVNLKPGHLDSVVFLLRGTVLLFSLHDQSIRNMETLVHVNSTDQLTGLDNRRSGGLKVNESLARGEHGAYLLVDCDNFKMVNEKFGNLVGDHLLMEIARVLRNTFPQGTCMRLGGDEFGVFFPLLESDRVLFGQWMYRFFQNLNQMKVDGLVGYRPSFSIGAQAYRGGQFQTFDQLYQCVLKNCRKAKGYEGNYVMSDLGGIPDLETAFYLLRADRHLYDRLNDDLFKIGDQQAWLRYLDNGAMLKSDMCWRNQRQFEQIQNYFAQGNVIEDDYERLYNLVLAYRNSLDAFMAEYLVGTILLPHYEELYASGKFEVSENVIRGRLAKLYLHMGDSLIGIHLMGETADTDHIYEMFQKCLAISEPLKREDPAYEYQIYALCQLIGHYELFHLPQVTSEQRDEYYLQLRAHVLGPKAVTLRDPILLPYYTFLLQNARCYPVLRAAQLSIKEGHLTQEDREELHQKLLYVRQHLDNGVLDTCYPHEYTQRIDRLLLAHLYRTMPASELFAWDYKELAYFRDSQNAVYNTADIMSLLILLLAAVSAMKLGHFSREEGRAYTKEAWELFLQLFKRRKNEATDRQSSFFACFILSRFLGNRMLTAQDKFEYMVRSLGVLTLDTYSHSKAMAAYAEVITSHLIDHRPRLLVGVLPGINDTASVKSHRRELLDFMRTGCLLHDIGKLRQTPIISNSYRKLTDHEFRLLRLHPSEGRSMLSVEPWFDQWADIIEGHHVTYDGKGGYPRNYEFVHPEQRILVDIVSICDSLEAATSRIGRNYRSAKPFCQIMDEFYAEAGTRYNPQIIESIISSSKTYSTLKHMVDEDWKNIYQGIFQEIVNDSHVPFVYDYKPAHNLQQRAEHVRLDQSMSVAQLRRIIRENETHNRWLSQQLIGSMESHREYDQLAQGLKSVYEVMALVKVEDGSIKILQGPPPFLRDFPPQEYHPEQAMNDYSIRYVVKPEWAEHLLAFCDHTTLAQRLQGRKSINVELETQLQGWCRYSYCPAEYDEHGNLDKALFMCECIDEELKELRKLKLIAEYDGLTGLRSRYGGEQQICQLLAKQTPAVFAVMDMDGFKKVNDTYGHAVGDKTLVELGKVFVHDEDSVIIRHGGDEFVAFFMHDISEEEATRMFDRFFDAIASIVVPELQGRKVCLSVGAVIYDGKEPVSFDEIFRRADHLLYESKRFEGSHLTIEQLTVTSNS